MNLSMRFVIPLFGSDTGGRDGVATLPRYCSGTCASDWTQCDCPLPSTYRTCAALCPATARIRLASTNSATTRERIIGRPSSKGMWESDWIFVGPVPDPVGSEPEPRGHSYRLR